MLDAVLALNETDTKVFDFASQAAPPADEPAGHITVPNAHLLFNGDFQRVGTSDLKIVGDDGASFFIRDYFAADKLSHLISPEGATLSASVVAALAGPLAPGQSAQAGAQQAGQPVIGRVDALSGSCTVVRNGVSVALNIGDTVRKGDVVQTAGGSAVAIVFADGSTFSLNANARMVLDEFVYNAGGAGNSALISLVQGTFSFVAGQVAKTGDMRVDTPVATMGIRGTAVLIEISANDGQTRFSVMVEPDGTTGSFTLYDKTSGSVIGTVNNSQIGWLVTPAGPLQVVAQQLQKTPAQLQQELGIVQQIFTIFNNNQQNPFVPDQQQDPNRRGDNPNDPNPQTAQGGGGSGGVFDSGQLGTSPLTPSQQQLPGGTTTVTVTPINHTLPNPNVPVIPETNAPLPTVPLPTGTFTIIHGTDSSDDGNTGNPPVLVGTTGNDRIYGHDGDDIIVAGSGGNDIYDGGNGKDTLTFAAMEGAANANGVEFDLKAFSQISTAQSQAAGNDTFINIEKIVGSAGNDTFILNDNTAWEIDAGSGVDTVSFVGSLSFLRSDVVERPLLKNVEIIDLNESHQNTIDVNIEDIFSINSSGVLRVVGGTGDQINLLSSTQFGGYWQKLQSGVEFTGDTLTNNDLFDVYGLYLNGNSVVVYVDTDITITGPENTNRETISWIGNGSLSTFENRRALELNSGATPEDSIEAFLGLDNNSIDKLDADATVGSALAFNVFLGAGQTLSVDWFFDGKDYLPFNDFVFASITPLDQTSKLSNISQVGDYGDSDAWQTKSFAPDLAGYYRIGFGVVDVGDSALPSSLYISNLRFEGTSQNDVLYSTVLNDTFVFKPAGGHDVITDFNADAQSPGRDLIDLTAFECISGIEDLAALMSEMECGASGTVISLNEDQSITILGVQRDMLEQSSFIFHMPLV